MTAKPEVPVDIANLALIAMGERPDVQDLDNPEVNTSHEVLALEYDNARRVALRAYVWNFAQVYDSLPRLGAGTDGFADKYRLPNDAVRINTLGSDREDPIRAYELYYDASGTTIHVSNSGGSLPIRYNKDVTDVLLMDPMFIYYFSLTLAERTALAITQKKSVKDSITAQINSFQAKAVSVDGQERPPRRVQHSKYLAARRGGFRDRTKGNRYYDIT